MYSLNVPVPGEVERLAEELRPELFGFDAIRDRHTLLCKRLGEEPPGGVARLREQVRTALVGAPAFEVRISGIDYFEVPTFGTAPVLYFSVESPGLWRVHRRLVEAFGAVDELEGDDYTPHITLARDGTAADAQRLAELDIEPVTWSVSHLELWDATYKEAVAEFSLPA